MPTREKKGNRESSGGYLISLLLTIISMVVGTMASFIAFGSRDVRPIIYAVILPLFLVAATMIVTSVEREPTKVATLKNSLINAFCGAIESSPLNPKTTSEGKQ
jgi:hypothetical protein